MIRFRHRGDFKRTEKFLDKASKIKFDDILSKYGRIGVDALMSATPSDSGTTSSCWYYEIESSKDGCAIYWNNSNVNKGVNIAIILQYGHGTGTGGYVNGIDYINPAIKPIFDKISTDLWKELTER